MTTEATFRLAFVILLLALIVMRIFFMIKVRRSGERLTKENHLVTTGPHSRIRHPLYTAMIVWSATAALLTTNWIFVAAAVLSITGRLTCFFKEERIMLDTFLGEYTDYMQQTGEFFPRLIRRRGYD
jgi:protein-S-isoprenylcysteine O-methyltransferase Ste14